MGLPSPRGCGASKPGRAVAHPMLALYLSGDDPFFGTIRTERAAGPPKALQKPPGVGLSAQLVGKLGNGRSPKGILT
jgi:hypothetical protein